MRLRRYFGSASVVFVLLASLLLSACSTTQTNLRKPWSDTRRGTIHVDLGVAYMGQGKLRIAKHELEIALKLIPDNDRANHAMALLMLRLKEPVKANAYFNKAVTSNPENASAADDYGSYLCQSREFAKADQQYQRALRIRLNPRPDLTNTLIALCYQKQPKKYAQARLYLEHALEINPRLEIALLGMARQNVSEQKDLAARAYIERYLAVAKPTPTLLLLAVGVEQRMGDNKTAAEYARQLQTLFPKSQALRELDQRRQSRPRAKLMRGKTQSISD
ncbi:MAG TPA: type IV pilus biogenesis/stability protein PilW [Gammaproteobacteria bacterium]|nr:type IV pilus biogenesis/stability protein PilW [Gammaproteobacteria bacterium]